MIIDYFICSVCNESFYIETESLDSDYNLEFCPKCGNHSLEFDNY